MAKKMLMGLMLCISLFLTPLTVFAEDNGYEDNGYEDIQPSRVTVAPPVVQAELVGRLLRVTASPGFYQVEAIYINGRRFNHRVDSVLILDVGEYVAQEQTISVYAIDFAGNRSNVAMITPPPFVSPHTITPEGDAIIIDNYLSAANIEFFTFNTANNNWLHLVIDRNRAFNNVYLLSPVNELDLLDLAAAAGLMPPPEPPIVVEVPVVVAPEPTPTPPPPLVAEPTPMNPIVRGFITLAVILTVIGGVGVGYYFLKIKGKGQGTNDMDDDDDDDVDESEFVDEE